MRAAAGRSRGDEKAGGIARCSVRLSFLTSCGRLVIWTPDDRFMTVATNLNAELEVRAEDDDGQKPSRSN